MILYLILCLYLAGTAAISFYSGLIGAVGFRDIFVVPLLWPVMVPWYVGFRIMVHRAKKLKGKIEVAIAEAEQKSGLRPPSN